MMTKYRHEDEESFALGEAHAFDLYSLANYYASIPDADPFAIRLFRELADRMPRNRPEATVAEVLSTEDAAAAVRAVRIALGMGS